MCHRLIRTLHWLLSEGIHSCVDHGVEFEGDVVVVSVAVCLLPRDRE